MTLPIILTATVLLAVATLLPLWRHPVWWVRGWDFPRLQLFCIAAALLVAQLLLDLAQPINWLLLATTALCLAYQGWWIAPYTRLHPTEVARVDAADKGPAIRILTTNVLMSNRNAEGLLELVRSQRPDLLVTLESDSWWESQLDTLATDYPHALKCPLDNLYGMHLYSRLPLSDTHIDFLVEDDAPSMHALVELPAGPRIRAHFLHPAPPSPTENDSSSERDAELVIVARSVADCDGPVIVTGDLNDVAWSYTTRLFRKLSGLLDPRVGRGMFNTFHAHYPFARWPLDHLFHSRHFQLRRLQRLPDIGSDHFPLLTELVYVGELESPPDPLRADADDQAVADAKAADQNVDQDDVPTPGAP